MIHSQTILLLKKEAYNIGLLCNSVVFIDIGRSSVDGRVSSVDGHVSFKGFVSEGGHFSTIFVWIQLALRVLGLV